MYRSAPSSICSPRSWPCGITDVDIHIDGPEVPIIDGSALPFMHLIDAAGIRELGTEIPVLRLREPVELVEGEKSIRIVPANRLIIKYKIDFNHPVIGRESFHFDFGHDSFLRKIAPARTFGFMRDVEKLRAAGLARGGSVENAVVLDDRGVVNGPLRFKDEFVRHKILDLVGDLALIGRPHRRRDHRTQSRPCDALALRGQGAAGRGLSARQPRRRAGPPAPRHVRLTFSQFPTF